MTESDGSTFVGGRPVAGDPEIDLLLHPSRLYARPADLGADELLAIDERLAILASWASDACAVDSNPPLRRPPLVSPPVTFDEIMNALRRLDRMKRSTPTPARKSVCSRGPAARISPIEMW
jgi:hypothetical protein